MRFKKEKLSLLALAMLIVLSLNAIANAQEVTVKSLQACIPDWGEYFDHTRTGIVSSTTEGSKEYYLLHLYQVDSEYPDPLVISRSGDNNDCTEEYLDISGSNLSLSEALGDVGQKLTNELYKKELKELGKEGLQKQINEAAAKKETEMTWRKDDVVALKKLDIKIPNNVVMEVE